MANYLLDSNVLVALANKPSLLGKNTRRILTTEPNIHYSSISVFELEAKTLSGKLPKMDSLYAHLVDNQIYEKPFTSVHALATSRFKNLDRHDPFDRMLICQAAADDYLFITSDEKLLNLGLPWVISSHE
jgi:PIN domain nuclease of toxin-antitoxin system